jgi:hypothetical protein
MVAVSKTKVDQPTPHATIVCKFFADGSYSVDIQGEGPRVTQRILERAMLKASSMISVAKRQQHRIATEQQAIRRREAAAVPVETLTRPTQEYPTNG